MNRMVLNREMGRVEVETPKPLPPMQEQPRQVPQNHVWYHIGGRWYPIPRNTALAKGYAYQDDAPDGPRCEDWQRRVDMING